MRIVETNESRIDMVLTVTEETVIPSYYDFTVISEVFSTGEGELTGIKNYYRWRTPLVKTASSQRQCQCECPEISEARHFCLGEILHGGAACLECGLHVEKGRQHPHKVFVQPEIFSILHLLLRKGDYGEINGKTWIKAHCVGQRAPKVRSNGWSGWQSLYQIGVGDSLRMEFTSGGSDYSFSRNAYYYFKNEIIAQTSNNKIWTPLAGWCPMD